MPPVRSKLSQDRVIECHRDSIFAEDPHPFVVSDVFMFDTEGNKNRTDLFTKISSIYQTNLKKLHMGFDRIQI